MTTLAPQRPTTTSNSLLETGKLSRRDLALIVVGSVAFTLLLFATTGFGGRAGFVVVLVLVYAVAQTAASFAREGRRQAQDRLLTLCIRLAVGAALLPLVLVLGYTVYRGIGALTPAFLTHSMKGVGPLDAGGGIYHAIIGTLQQVLLTMLIAVPLGLLVAIYLAEYGRGRFASLVRFVVDVMTGVPSIVAGLFIYAFWVIPRGPSGFAAALALSILMLPVIVRSAEEMIKLVPDSLREAAYALGVPRWKTILRVVLPTASAGITTGVMLAVARVTGETAPLLLTAQSLDAINTDPFHGRQSALASYVYDQASSAGDNFVNRAWGAALALIIVVLVLYVAARLLTRRNSLARS
ncbi:MAG: phosphate transport system permease protein [Frankiaceae bacterium]|nr:phosphate transport system permease protein [Frankiaceae bacterium]